MVTVSHMAVHHDEQEHLQPVFDEPLQTVDEEVEEGLSILCPKRWPGDSQEKDQEDNKHL